MWSASSSTVISTASRLTNFCFIRSSRRPGHATTMSTPALSAADLTVLGDATEDGGDPQVVGGGEGLEGCGDLGGELAGRGQDQAERAARATLAAGQLRRARRDDHRDGEGERLTAAGLAAAEHVAARQRVGEGVDLDRERGGDPLAVSAFTSGAGTPSAPKDVSVKDVSFVRCGCAAQVG